MINLKICDKDVIMAKEHKWHMLRCSILNQYFVNYELNSYLMICDEGTVLSCLRNAPFYKLAVLPLFLS
jgi:hypothetical protein